MEGKLPVTCFCLSVLNAAVFPDYSTHKGAWVYRLAIQQSVLHTGLPYSSLSYIQACHTAVCPTYRLAIQQSVLQTCHTAVCPTDLPYSSLSYRIQATGAKL